MRQSANHKDLVVEVNLQDVFSSNSSSLDLGVLPIDRISQSQWQNWFTRWLELLDPPIIDRRVCELTLRLTDDREIKDLNAKYRDRNRPTDVLAFAALEIVIPQPSARAFLEEPLYLGDVIISVDTAYRQAQEQKHSLTKEIIWLAAHGFLHLLGWDHPDDKSLNQMIDRQETLLQIDSLRDYIDEINY
ncbi:MAG: rRNA maturation RNase YbeY [Prochloraceae cyanobacterium]|nr:rRNA maturation RNase YbeY [Prochloraceae cyanobacterium]